MGDGFPTQFRLRVRLNHTSLSLLPFFLFFLSDNYLPDIRVRPLDFIGLAVLVVLSTLRICSNGKKLNVPRGSLCFTGVALIYLLISLAFRPEQMRPHVGIMLGLFVFIYYRGLSSVGGAYTRGLSRILQISVIALFAQIAYYLITGVVLKLVLVAGGDVRVWYGGTILRPTGFFMEPNSYCLATAMLVLLRRQIMGRPFDTLSYIAIGSMFVSMSLWGGAVGLLLVAYDLLSRGVRVALISVFVLLPSIVLLGVILFENLGEENPFRVTMVDRATNIMMSVMGSSDSDLEGSYRDRYSALTKLIDLDDFDYRIFVGNGISTSDFQEYGGANGPSFLIYSFGLIGIMLFAFAIIASAKGGLGQPFAILISLSSYPLVTYFYWWAWLGLLLTVPAMAVSETGVLRTRAGNQVRPPGDARRRHVKVRRWRILSV